jgi:hypothetical protein
MVAGVVWSPLRTSSRGVRDINKMSQSLLCGADGVVIQLRNEFVSGTYSPPQLRGFLMIAQTPSEKRGKSATSSLGNTPF